MSILNQIPVSMCNSRLLRRGGFDVFEGLPDADGCAALLCEAQEQLTMAQATDQEVDDGEEVRGGTPARRFLSAPAGPVQTAFYQSPELADCLGDICGFAVAPTGKQGTYSYYVRPGDHLALHRDIRACDLAVITCLYDDVKIGFTPDALCNGGILSLYPDRISEPLSAIRATPEQNAVNLSTLR